ncbi:MAG: 2-oxoacid:acceptor oxidoreductase family protein [Planctomycetota bacterium]
MKIRFAGFGGQGVVMCGVVFGQAAMGDGLRSQQTQSYGSASRGGLTHSDVVIQEEEIYDLVNEEIDVLVAMSQMSCDRFTSALAPGGKLFYEEDLVRIDPESAIESHGIRATDIAFMDLGRKVVMNMVMMGFVNEIAEVVTHDSLLKAILSRVPKGTERLNEKAYREGAARAKALREVS